MTAYNPDKWVLLEFTKDGSKVTKVLGGWGGGYLHGSSWRLNSGITKVDDDGDALVFHGHTGSQYRCSKQGWGMSGFMANLYSAWMETQAAHIRLLGEEESLAFASTFQGSVEN